MSPLTILHFDDESFCTTLRTSLVREFPGMVDVEAHRIEDRASFERLKTRIQMMADPAMSVDMILLDLRLESRPSLEYYSANVPEAFEGIEVLKLIHGVDPQGKIKRAILTRTKNWETARRNFDFAAVCAEFFSKEVILTQGREQSITLPFPENIFEYVRRTARDLGKWS